MAVHDIDPMSPKKLDESTNACRVYRSVETKGLGGNSSVDEHVSHPAGAVARAHREDRMTSTLELERQTEYHHLSAAGPVRLDHHRDPQPVGPRYPRRHRAYAVRPATGAGRGGSTGRVGPQDLRNRVSHSCARCA